MAERRSKLFYTLSPKPGNQDRPRFQLDTSITASSPDSERKSNLSSPSNLFYSSIERELNKVYHGLKIKSQKDILDSIKKITSDIFQGNFLCSSCKTRIYEIEHLTSEIKNQKTNAIDEIEKIRELKGQVKKYETLLKNKEKNFELQQISISESREEVERKLKWVENSLVSLENEKKKVREERRKLEEDKLLFDKKFKQLDEFFIASKEISQPEILEKDISTEDRVEVVERLERLIKLSTELQKKQDTAIGINEKFNEMEEKIEKNYKNLEFFIKDNLSFKDNQENITKNKLKKLKNYVKSIESKLSEIAYKKEDNFSNGDEIIEKVSTKSIASDKELADKDSLVYFYKAKCETLEESLRLKEKELGEFIIYSNDLVLQLKNIEFKEKELQEIQENLSQEKREIVISAETLKEVYIQLENQQNSLIEDMAKLEKEKKVYSILLGKKELNKIDEEEQYSYIGPPEMIYQPSTEEVKDLESPYYDNRQSLHFRDKVNF